MSKRILESIPIYGHDLTQFLIFHVSSLLAQFTAVRRNMILKFFKFQMQRSSPIFVINTSEIVRWKAYDLFFEKLKKNHILPHLPLIPVTIEEG